MCTGPMDCEPSSSLPSGVVVLVVVAGGNVVGAGLTIKVELTTVTVKATWGDVMGSESVVETTGFVRSGIVVDGVCWVIGIIAAGVGLSMLAPTRVVAGS